MGRNINTTKLSKKLVLDKVSQITIFSTYLNLSDKIIQYCIDTGEFICSPIRVDNNPTCGFKYDSRGKLKFKDFAGYFWGDCFDVVALIMSTIYNKPYDVNNKEDFIKILRHITFTFKDIFYGKEKDSNLINAINTSVLHIKHSKPKIELVIRNWNNNDIDYWNKFGVPIQFLNINFVYAVDQYYINKNSNPKPKYFYDSKDPCYAYMLGQDKTGIYNIKLYFPCRTKAVTRFITNCNHLEGIYNLDRTDYDYIILTKSSKDRLSIGATLKQMYSLYGREIKSNIGVINIPHETYRLRQNEYDWLNSKLKPSGKIVSLMDNDTTGKQEAIWLRINYSITPLLIPVGYNAKDFAELVSNNKKEIVYKLILDTYNKINNHERKIDKLVWNTKEDDALPY